MSDYSEESLRTKLGLTDEMSTYFLRAPSEYWKELGKKPQPYDDNIGEYEFIHAFFTDKEEMSNFADILESKLAVGGMLWISWRKVSALSDNQSYIDGQDIRDVFLPLGLVDAGECSVTEEWSGLKLTHSNS